ncbi:MAG: hypothetical protein ACPLZG_03900 [Thermoproteota archaeon]
MSKDKFLVVKCPKCGKFMGINEKSSYRICPFCGSKVTKKNVVSIERMNAVELEKRIKFLNKLTESKTNLHVPER